MTHASAARPIAEPSLPAASRARGPGHLASVPFLARLDRPVVVEWVHDVDFLLRHGGLLASLKSRGVGGASEEEPSRALPAGSSNFSRLKSYSIDIAEVLNGGLSKFLLAAKETSLETVDH